MLYDTTSFNHILYQNLRFAHVFSAFENLVQFMTFLLKRHAHLIELQHKRSENKGKVDTSIEYLGNIKEKQNIDK
jgi:hypothetical protein